MNIEQREFAITSKKLGFFMRKERKRRGLTQVEVAGMIGISQSTLSKMERGVGLRGVIVFMQWVELILDSGN